MALIESRRPAATVFRWTEDVGIRALEDAPPAPSRCLVLGGGGAKGAFQVGALDYLVNVCGLRFPLIAGVSVGALNGVVMAQTHPDRLPQAIEDLKTIWLAEIKGPESVYTRRGFGAASIVAFKSDSLYDNTPLRRLVQRWMRVEDLRASPTLLRVGRVSLQTGKFVTVDSAHMTLDDVIASTAFPYYFEPVRIGGEPFADGGLRNVAPIETAFELLGERAPGTGPKILYAILSTPAHVRPLPNIDILDDALKILERAIEILGAEAYEQDLRLAEDVNRHVGALARLREVLLGSGSTPDEVEALFRRAGVPAHAYPHADLLRIEPEQRIMNFLDFSPPRIRQAMEHGAKMAEKAVAHARAMGVPL